MEIYIRQSKLSVKMKYLGFAWRVLRRLVWETSNQTAQYSPGESEIFHLHREFTLPDVNFH